MICPRCGSKLKGVLQDAGFVHVCFSCNGRAVSLSVVRKLVTPLIIKDLWQRVISHEVNSEIQCPSCNQKMSNVTLHIDDKTEYFDVCPKCHFIWFDPKEFERLPKKEPKKNPKKELSPEAKKIIALAKIDSLKKQQELVSMGVGSPDHWWELILGIFGMPVEYNNHNIRKAPLATYFIAAAIIFVTGISFLDLDSTILEWGLIPNQFARHFGLTFISSFLLHGGIIHLIGNLYFLLVFGDNVEDTLDIKYYLFLIVLSTMVGDLAHILAYPRATTPLIGASGGISGILTYYCLRFPKAKVGILFLFRWLRIPASVMLLFWIVAQIFGAYNQISGFSNISALAHLGGALVGVIFWLATRNAPSPENVNSRGYM